jgi:SAM-dependent methyltransferase
MNPTNGDGRAFWQQRSFKDERDIILASGPVAVVTRLQNTFRDAMLLRLKRLLGDRLPARKLVDIGCAIGDWTLAYAHNGFASEVVGVEFNQGFVARARESAARFGGAAGQLRFVEGDANTTDEIAGADLVCMGGFLQSLTEAEATALLERVAQAQRGGGAMYIRTSCPPRGGARPPNDYHRSHDWYQACSPGSAIASSTRRSARRSRCRRTRRSSGAAPAPWGGSSRGSTPG